MRIVQTDRWGTYIRDLQPLGAVTRTRDLDGTDQLELTVQTDADKGDRIMAVDTMGRVCEWEVSSIDAVRESGAPALDLVCTAGYGELSLAWIDEKQNTDYSAAACLEKALDGTRWEVGTCESGTLDSTATTSWYHESVSDALEEICDTYGLELEASYELDSTGTTIAARYINLYEQRGSDNGKRFTYGKDLTGIRRTIGSTRPITRCYGYGKGVEITDEETGETTGGYSRKIDFADVNDGLEYVDAGDDYLALWGVPGPDGDILPAVGVYENGDCEDEEQLLAETIAYLAEACEPTVSYTCDVAALGVAGVDAEGVDVGDTVQIVDTTFPTPLRLSGRVTQLVEDLRAGAGATTVTLGSVVESYAARQASIEQALETVRSNASAWSSAAAGTNTYISDLIARINELMNTTGGYVYLVEGEGIYVYDQPVDESPTACIHIGGGYWRCANSKTSSGEWDWQTMADGSGLYAGALYTGILSDAAGENYWNLDTGELSISAGATIGDYTVSSLTVAVEGITSTVESAVSEQVGALSATYLTADELTEVLTAYVSGTSLADALAAYATTDDLTAALDGYATVTYVTENYSTVEQTATAITTTVAEELTAYATIEYSDAADDDTLAVAENYADSAVDTVTGTITAAYTSAIEQTATDITTTFTSSTGANLLTDPGFESTAYGGDLPSGFAYSTTSPHSGDYCMACTGAGTRYYFNHVYGDATDPAAITVEPGETYTYSMWYKASSSSAAWASDNMNLRIATADGNDTLIAAHSTDSIGTDWTQLTGTWTNSAGHTEVHVMVATSVTSGTVYVDDAFFGIYVASGTLIRESSSGVEVAKMENGSYTSTRTLMDDEGFHVQDSDGTDLTVVNSSGMTIDTNNGNGTLTISSEQASFYDGTYQYMSMLGSDSVGQLEVGINDSDYGTASVTLSNKSYQSTVQANLYAQYDSNSYALLESLVSVDADAGTGSGMIMATVMDSDTGDVANCYMEPTKTYFDTTIYSETSNMAISHTHSTSGSKVAFGVGSGGSNRGIFDYDNNRWLIYANSSGATLLQTQGGAYYATSQGNKRVRYIDLGSVTISGGSGSVTSATVTFNVEFDSTPYVFVTASTTVPGVVTEVSVSGRSTTGCTVYVLRSTSSSTGVQWMAVGYVS